jgi:DNA-binding transcriptional MerR regulator
MARRTSTSTASSSIGQSSIRKRRRTARGEVILVSRSAFCAMCGISERQLALWENEDLVAPVKIEQSGTRTEPLYDRNALRRARVIRTLDEELEVNLPGIGVILNLLDRLQR